MSTSEAGPLFQNSFYVGNILNAILYGVELVLYFQTIHRLRKGHNSRKFLIFFSTVLLFCGTVFFMSQCLLAQEMWVVHQDWPGGSAAYFKKYVSAWYQTFGTTACILLDLMSAGLLIHRCWTIWCRNWKVVFFPCVLWVLSLAFGVLELYASGKPSSDFFTGFAVKTGLAYFSLAIGLNVTTTCIICWRIISYGRTMRKGLGEEFASTYFTLASIIVESALPYTLFGVSFLVAFGTESQLTELILPLYEMFACISPQMLILRVAEGRAWKSDTATHRPSTVAFAVTETTDQSHVKSVDGATAMRSHIIVPPQSDHWKSTKLKFSEV